MKIAYMGIDLMVSALTEILAQGHEILKVFTCQTDNVTEFHREVTRLAQENGIECTDKRIRSDDLRRLAEAGCELLLCAGYYYRAPLIDAFPMINIHPAPLPEYRGSWPMPILLMQGKKAGGVTMHKMAKDFDTGDILMEESFPLEAEDTLESYMEKANARIPDMVRRLLADVQGVVRKGRPQGQGVYWPAQTEADWTIGPRMTEAEADRVLRAYYGYECVYASAEGKYELIRGRIGDAPDEKARLPVAGGYVQAERIRRL